MSGFGDFLKNVALAGLAFTRSITKVGNTLVVFGDSNTAAHWNTVSYTSASRTAGVVTVNVSSNPFMTGQTVMVEQCPDKTVNGRWTVTRVSNTVFQFSSPGPDGAISLPTIFRTPYQKSDIGWPTWLRMFLGNRINLLNNAGVGGDTTADMLARIQTDVLAYKPAMCTVMGGTNDVLVAKPTAGTVASVVASTVANLKAIYALLRANGITVYAMTMYPIPSGYSNWSLVWNQAVIAINEAIRQECANNPNTILIDVHAVMVDPTSTQGNPKANYLQNYPAGTNVHTAAMGAFVAGLAAFKAMDPRVPKVDTLAIGASDNRANNAGSTNVFRYLPSVANGGTVGGTATGTPPTGTKVESQVGSPIVTASSIARTVANDGDDRGYNTRMVFQAQAANDAARITNADTGYYADVKVGNAYYWEATVKVSGLSGSNVKSIDCGLRFSIDAGAVQVYAYDMASNGTTYPTTDWSGTVKTAPFFLAGGTTVSAAQPALGVAASAAGSAVTIEMGVWTLREIPAGSPLIF